MKELIEDLTKIISRVVDKQSTIDTEILKIRYENLELLKILKENHQIDNDAVKRIYKKGETNEQSSNESRSSGDIHQSLS